MCRFPLLTTHPHVFSICRLQAFAARVYGESRALELARQQERIQYKSHTQAQSSQSLPPAHTHTEQNATQATAKTNTRANAHANTLRGNEHPLDEFSAAAQPLLNAAFTACAFFAHAIAQYTTGAGDVRSLSFSFSLSVFLCLCPSVSQLCAAHICALSLSLFPSVCLSLPLFLCFIPSRAPPYPSSPSDTLSQVLRLCVLLTPSHISISRVWISPRIRTLSLTCSLSCEETEAHTRCPYLPLTRMS